MVRTHFINFHSVTSSKYAAYSLQCDIIKQFDRFHSKGEKRSKA